MFGYLLQRQIKVGLKNLSNRKRSFLNFASIHRILIFFDAKDLTDVLVIAEDLKNNGKDVILWTFGNDLNQFPSDVKVINPSKDINWMQNIRPELVSEFDNLNYDTFIDLSVEDNMYMLYLKIKNTSKFSIGIKESLYKLYDFILLKEDTNSIFDTYQQMKIYLINNT